MTLKNKLQILPKQVLSIIKKQPRNKLIVVVLSLFACMATYKWLMHPKQVEPIQRLPLVLVMKSTAVDFSPFILVSGVTKASTSVTICSETTGRIIDLPTFKGQFVKKDQSLVIIVDNDRAARLAEAKAKLAHKEAEYQASSKLTAKAIRTENALLAAKADFESAKAALSKIETEVDQLSIKAPFDGFYQQNLVEVGDFVNVGDKVATVVALDPLKIQVELSSTEVKQVSANQKAKINFGSQDNIDAKVIYISKVADPKTRTFSAELEMSNVGNQFSDGGVVDVSIYQEKIKVHKIPPSILTLRDDGVLGIMLVDQNNEAKFKPITFLQTDDESIIVKGLPDQATIISVGAEFIKDGQKVEPKSSS